jgi:hypothetical protein
MTHKSLRLIASAGLVTLLYGASMASAQAVVHVRRHFHHLCQHRARNHHHWNCWATCSLLYRGPRIARGSDRHNHCALSCSSRAGSRHRRCAVEYSIRSSDLYNSLWRQPGRGSATGSSGWTLPSWLLRPSWRPGHNRRRNSNPRERRRVHLQVNRRGAYYRSQYHLCPGARRLPDRCILGCRGRHDTWSKHCVRGKCP